MSKIKVGQLALKAGVLPSTVRYYAKEGLLKVADRTPGGYQLFDEEESLKVINQIQKLKDKRMSISEIKDRLSRNGGEK